RLRTRLITSYVLVAAVPVLLVAAFLILAAYLAMGSGRAETASRLLMPGADTRRALTALAHDPALAAALAADRHPDDLDSAARDLDRAVTRELSGRAPFLMAARRVRADTSRFVLRFAPETAVPPAIRIMSEPIPPIPTEALIYAGNDLYATTSVAIPDGDDELLLRAFAPVDSQKLSDVADAVSAHLELYTSDSLSVETGKKSVSINFDTGQKGPPRRVMSSTPKKGGAQGAYVVRGFRVDPGGALDSHDSILLLQIPPMGVVTQMRDTAANPINFLVLLVLGVIAGLFLLVESWALWIGTRIARSIHQAVLSLHHGTRRIAEDDLDHRIEIDRGDELGDLGQAFNAMAEGLKERRQL
ncbi:MAG TPA: HAMP domain-containing protein, partial [Candidatus Udaeobacter sp.]|nr:HAMP domain-containing protein [Candidatus Udaeobacter sp.]